MFNFILRTVINVPKVLIVSRFIAFYLIHVNFTVVYISYNH